MLISNRVYLDFRVSVLKVTVNGTQRVVVTTIVNTHNLFGRVYVWFILPFHRLAVRTLISNAVAAHRV
jgi:hypothetical protein